MLRKRVSFDRLVEKSYWLWRDNPCIIVPTMLASALQVVVQGSVFVILIPPVAELLARSSFRDAVRNLSQGNLNTFLKILAEPSILLILILTIIAAVVVGAAISVLGGGIVASSEYGTYSKLVRSERPTLADVIYNFWSMWRRMAWTTLILGLLTYGVLAPSFLPFLFLSFFGMSSFGIPQLISLALIPLGGILFVIIAFYTVYTYPAVALEGTSGLSAVRRSFTIARRFRGLTLTYAVVRSLSQSIFVGIALFSSLIGAPIGSIVSVALNLFLTPIFHLAKTQIFLETTVEKEAEIIFTPTPSILDDVRRYLPKVIWTNLKTGLKEFKSFTLELHNIPYHSLSAASLFFGIILGRVVTHRGLKDLMVGLGFEPGRINPEFGRVVPVFLGIDLFFHNWQVSLATILSGVFLLLPVGLAIFLNGFILGVVEQLVPSSTMFLAAILPHGIIEIPALLIAGSCGFKLGFTIVKTLFRKIDYSELHSAVRQAVFVALGLSVLFLVAGLIEGLITPAIMRMYGWR